MPPPVPLLLTLLLTFFTSPTTANVEKTIFLAPSPPPVSLSKSSTPRLPVLRPNPPSASSWRTSLPAAFPHATAPHEPLTWAVLRGLEPGRRYEVRVCWAATQPTSFRIDTFDPATVDASAELFAEIEEYAAAVSTSHHAHDDDDDDEDGDDAHTPATSTLLLRIHAAADYVSTNLTLMRDVPPVRAEIILDPFLFNVLPRSLAPTVCYLVVVAGVSYFVARGVVAGLHGVIARERERIGAEKKVQ